MPQSDYNVNIIVTAKDQASVPMQKAAKSADTLGKRLKEALSPTKALEGMMQGAGQAIGNFALQAVKQIPQVVMELTKLGIQAEAAELRFQRFAGGSAEAAIYLQAVQEAAGGTISKMDAMAASTKMLQMGLISNSDEMNTMAKIAIQLGDQTQSAGDRMNDFSLLLANRSVMRLDNFGIASGKVRTRVEELKKSGYDLDEAFKLAVLEEGRKSLERLGDTSGTAAHGVGVLTAALDDVKLGFGQVLAELVGGAGGGVDVFRWMADGALGLTNTMRNVKEIFWSSAVGITHFGTTLMDTHDVQASWTEGLMNARRTARSMSRDLDELIQTVTRYDVALIDNQREMESNRETELALAKIRIMSATGVSHITTAMGYNVQSISTNTDAHMQYQYALQETQRANDAARWAEVEQTRALEEQAQAAVVAQNAQLDMAMTLTQQLQRMEVEAGNAADARLVAESNYRDKMQELAITGTDEQIAEERRRHEETMRMMDEEAARLQQQQDQAMGQYMLQTFDQWAQASGIPPEEMGKMRAEIAEEYGLIDDGAAAMVADMIAEWERWASNTGITADEVAGYMHAVTSANEGTRDSLLELTAKEWNVIVNYQTTGQLPPGVHAPGMESGLPAPSSAPPPAQVGGGYRAGFQHGGSFTVGEAGPEIVTVQPLGGDSYNDTFNIYDGRAMATIHENRRRRRSASYARTM